MMRKIIGVLMASIAASAIAYVIAVAAPGNTNYTSAGTVGFRTTTDGTTNCVGATACNLANITIWDSVAGANGLSVNASGQLTISNTSFASKVNQWGGTAITNVPTAVGTAGTGNTPTLNSYIVGCVSPVCNANGQAVMAASAPVVIASNQSALPTNPGTIGTWGLAAATQNVATPTNGMLVQGEFNTTPTTITSGNSSPLQLDTNGNLLVNVKNANANGSNTAANSSPIVNPQTTPVLLNAITNTSKTIKGSAGQLVMLQCGNTNTSEVYVQIFNNAAPTVGTTTPALSIPIAASSTGGFALPGGIQFGTAITAAATATATGSGAPVTALDCNASYM